MNKPKVLIIDADGFALNTKPAMVFLEIQRSSIEECNISSTLEKLLVMTDSAANTRLYRESLLLSVSGYDADPRELAEIPEVRTFFKTLTSEWPNWLWFLNRESGAVPLLLSLLCRVKIIRTSTGAATDFLDKEELLGVIMELLKRGDVLLETYGIPEAEAIASAQSVLGIFR